MTVFYENEPLAHLDRRYDGTVMIAVAASEFGVTGAHHSIMHIYKRPGDEMPGWGTFTKGADARQHFTELFIRSNHDFILHLDGDMSFPADLLERLRSHRLPCVTGLYFRRTYNPMIPIWYEDDPDYKWPMMPFRGVPEPNRLYRLGATGAGCWLIHRSVYEAVEPLLRGEPYWLEDDMDVWPYDLEQVMAGKEQLRPLRWQKDRVGADLRLGFFIRQAGYTIWGDPAATCGHYMPYPLGATDWEQQSPGFHQAFAERTSEDIEQLRQQHLENSGAIARVIDGTGVAV